MPEQDANSAAAKFISSLVKSLQILCNGQVDFTESIELVGHINVRVDHKYKFDYIVDEQVSKEGEDSSTTFLSNSYHSCPPLKQHSKKCSPSQLEEDVLFTEIPKNVHRRSRHLKTVPESSTHSQVLHEDNSVGGEENNPNYSVTVESPHIHGSDPNQMVVKLEQGDDSNDCMVLPASPDDYDEAAGEAGGEGLPGTGPSASFEDLQGDQSGRPRKRRKPQEQGADDSNDGKGEVDGGGKSSGGKRGASELIGKFAAYECSYCSVILTEYEDLSVHSKNCPSPLCSMICLTCGEKFTSKPEMRQHLKFVHNHKTFGCKFCEMMFLSSSGLLSHTKAKHKPDPKTLCQICGQAFHNRANLEGHMNMHLGLKPFKCKKCGKSYGHSKSLLTHEKSCRKSRSVPSEVKERPPSGQQNQAQHDILAADCVSNASIGSAHHHLERGSPGNDRSARDIEPSNPEQSYSFSEPYQAFRDSKKLCNEEPDLQTMQNAGEPFSYDSSYQPLQTMDISGMSSANSVNEALGDNVFGQTSGEFVLPQVTYGMFPPGMLPDHR